MANRQAVRAAAAVFVLGLSLAGPPGILCLAGPAGIAFADSGPIDRGRTTPARTTGGPNDTGQSHGAAISPQREVRPAKASGGSHPVRLPVSSQRTAPSGGSRSGLWPPGHARPQARGAAGAETSRTASIGIPDFVEVPTAVARAADPATTSILAAAVQEPSPAVTVAGAGPGPGPGPAISHRLPHLPQPHGRGGPVRGFLNTVGQWLSDLRPPGHRSPVRRSLAYPSYTDLRRLPGRFVGTEALFLLRCRSHRTSADGHQRRGRCPGSLRDVLRTASSGDVIRFAPKLRHANLVLTEGGWTSTSRSASKAPARRSTPTACPGSWSWTNRALRSTVRTELRRWIRAR